MREIKFRVWIKDQKRIMPVSNLRVIDGKISVAYGGDFHVYFFEDEIELMQFTGLKDKSGKEIYEGDIVSWGGSMYGFGKVVYERYSFLVKYKLGEVEDEMYFNHPDAYTIIGNIHETPELLSF